MASFVFLTEDIGEITEWTIGLSAFHVIPNMESESFRTLVYGSCVCGRRLDLFGHHRAACSKAGVLSRRGFAVESAVEQICREAGARVSTNVMIRDLDIAGSNTDARRLEVVAEGLSIFGGAQLALDATLVSTHHGDGTPLRKSDKMDGVCFAIGKEAQGGQVPRVERITREGWGSWWWSRETQAFLQSLAHCKAQGAPRILRASTEVAWYRRWCCWRVQAAKAVAVSLLERRGNPGAAGQLPSVQEVLGDARREV